MTTTTDPDGVDPDAGLTPTERLAKSLEGVRGELGAERTARRTVAVVAIGLAVVALVVTVLAVWLGVRSTRQAGQIDDLVGQLVTTNDARRVDRCEQDNELRATLRLFVDLDAASASAIAESLADPSLREAAGAPARTPEQEAMVKRQVELFNAVQAANTAEERNAILAGLEDRDCRPEALNVAPTTPTSEAAVEEDGASVGDG